MRFCVPIDIFEIDIFFFIGKEESKRFLKATGLKDVDFDSNGFTAQNAVWLKDDNDMQSIIHEAHHVKKFIIERKGIKDEETEAYLITYIVSQVVKKIRRIKGEKV